MLSIEFYIEVLDMILEKSALCFALFLTASITQLSQMEESLFTRTETLTTILNILICPLGTKLDPVLKTYRVNFKNTKRVVLCIRKKHLEKTL